LKRVLGAVVVGLAFPATSPAAETLLTDFEGFAVGNEVIFQEPRFSGSTSGKLELTPNTSGVTDTFPSGLTNSGSFVYYTNFSFAAVADPLWVRLTTFNTPNLPNPVISFTQPLRFDIYSDRSLYVALGLRETNSAGAIGSNGGGTGPIEFVGGTTDNVPSPPLGRLIPANTWTSVEFNIPVEPVRGFTGNNILESTTGLGVLEQFALRAGVDGAGGQGVYNVYIDNIVVVPEPGIAALGLLGALALGFRRRRS
jgi:MYXO-CTERM domain-containing protein